MEEVGTINTLTITFTGDLKYGRTMHSLSKSKLLQHYNVRIKLVSPPSLSLPADVRQQMGLAGQLVQEGAELTKEVVARSDVLYCTRVQKERLEAPGEYEPLRGGLIVDKSVLKHAKPKMLVMHPLPRNEELSEEIDSYPRAAYFKQVCLASPVIRHGRSG